MVEATPSSLVNPEETYYLQLVMAATPLTGEKEEFLSLPYAGYFLGIQLKVALLRWIVPVSTALLDTKFGNVCETKKIRSITETHTRRAQSLRSSKSQDDIFQP